MVYIGLDLGKEHDYAALAVVEKLERLMPGGRREFACACVRYLERLPLGTPYTVLIERVRRLVRHPEIRGNCILTVDASGLGKPVIDMLRVAQLGCHITAVTISPGEHEHSNSVAGIEGYSVPKQDLIAKLRVLLEQGQLKFAEGMALERAMVRELSDVRVKRRDSGRDRIGADGYGQHDDLVIALALACWRMGRRAISY
jgi:hypothetical protein